MPHRLVIPFIPPGNGRRGSRRGWKRGQERGWVAGEEGRSKTYLRLTTAFTGGRKYPAQGSFIVIFSPLQNISQANYGIYGRTQKEHQFQQTPRLAANSVPYDFDPLSTPLA